MRDRIHLLTLWAGALNIGESKACVMTAAQADVGRLRPAEHAAELAPENTIGTAYDPFGHFSYELSFPSCLAPKPRCRPMVPTAPDEWGRHGTTTQPCLRRERVTLKEPHHKRKWPESRRASHDGALLSFAASNNACTGQSRTLILVHNSHATKETAWQQNTESSK
jgi:hypothetical protein